MVQIKLPNGFEFRVPTKRIICQTNDEKWKPMDALVTIELREAYRNGFIPLESFPVDPILFGTIPSDDDNDDWDENLDNGEELDNENE